MRERQGAGVGAADVEVRRRARVPRGGGDDAGERLDEASSCRRRWPRRPRRTRRAATSRSMSCSTSVRPRRRVRSAHRDERRAGAASSATRRDSREPCRRSTQARARSSGSARARSRARRRPRRAALRLERGAQLGRRQRAAGRARSPARRSRSAAIVDDRQPHAHGVQLVGAAAQHLVDGAVGGEAAVVVEHDDPVDEADGGVEVVLDEQDRAVAGRDELGERGVDLLDARAGRGSRSARRARAGASPSRGRTRSRGAGGRRPTAGRGSRTAAPRGRRGAARPRRARAPRPPASADSRVRRRPRRAPCRSRAARRGPGRPCATRVLSSATGVVGVSSPSTSTVPVTSAGHGVRDAGRSARASSVDLPDPLGPSSSTTSPGRDVEGDGCRSRRRLAVVGDAELAHPQQRHGSGTAAERGGRRRARVRSRRLPSGEWT